MYYTSIDFIILLYSFLGISFGQYKEYIISPILYSKFSDVLLAFTCARPIANLLKICLRVIILRLSWLESE